MPLAKFTHIRNPAFADLIEGERPVQKQWTRDFLMLRVDRCYRIAAWTKVIEKRSRYLDLARYYRSLLSETLTCSPLAYH